MNLLKVNHVWTNLCPHFAAATQSNSSITLDDFLYDEATLSTLKVELLSLITGRIPTYIYLWYFVSKIVVTYCEKKNVLVIEICF